MTDLEALTTESRNRNSIALDRMSPFEIAEVMNREDQNVIYAVRQVLPQVANAIELCTESLKKGGRIIYMGAGTSGRLGLLDAVECPPTFGVASDLVVGLIAGGDGAFLKAVEGAEDSCSLGQADLENLGLSGKDIVVGIAASGRTPYVIYGMRYAKSMGCKTVSLVCNRETPIAKEGDVVIEPIVGPEVLTGSTRLKAGTAQKMILNMISTGSMVGIGKVYQNLMVDLMQTNEKLIIRAENIVMAATECSRKRAKREIDNAKGSVKLAITAILLGKGTDDAEERLQRAEGHVRKAISS